MRGRDTPGTYSYQLYALGGSSSSLCWLLFSKSFLVSLARIFLSLSSSLNWGALCQLAKGDLSPSKGWCYSICLSLSLYKNTSFIWCFFVILSFSTLYSLISYICDKIRIVAKHYNFYFLNICHAKRKSSL